MKIILTSLIVFIAAAGGAGAVSVPMGMRAVGPASYRAPMLPTPMAPVPAPSAPPTKPTNPTEPETPPYTVDNCMSDMRVCADGALPGGINALYNADMRNSVINGMNLCGNVVDKCVNEAVRVDGAKAYYVKNDVWIDFNSRVIQPEYYSMVLRKTGLTPNQAENTCWLLDKNVEDSSFMAITRSDRGMQLGQEVNTRDWARNSYARWDAATGDCLVRVAAYNKDDLITEETHIWITGSEIGSGRPAEVWVPAGTAITCKKALFEDLNLMRTTIDVAVNAGMIGVGGGAAIGAVAGYNSKNAPIRNCNGLDPDCCGIKEYQRLLNKAAGSLGNASSPDGCRDLINQLRNTTPSADDTLNQNRSMVEANMEKLTKPNADKWGSAGKGALVGASVGAGAAGIATAIAAFVDMNNITCHIGNKLDSVAIGKSTKIKTLKDYYVQWALNLPDTVMPQQTVTTCAQWHAACGTIVNIYDCAITSLNFKPAGSDRSTQVDTACDVSGNMCVANTPVAVSYGACP